MTPASWNSASTTVSLAASAPVCDAAARAPDPERPALTATIGFCRLTRRAICRKRSGFPKLSRYSRMTRVRGSCSQYSSRSFEETSALLPMETKFEMPRCSCSAYSRMARPSAPLWLEKAIGPAGGKTGEKLAFRWNAGSVLSTPMQLGPTIRMP